LTWYDTRTGQVVGRAIFRISQNLQLRSDRRSFAENFDLRVTSVTGGLSGASLNLSVRCGGTCTATSHFPNGSAIVAGSGVTAGISYGDSTNTVNRTNSTYTLSWGPGTITPLTWTSPVYRCDNLFRGVAAGCVVPGATPVLTTMAPLTGIAANIRRIQQGGLHHYGRKADGLPLSRNSSLETVNRNIACPRSRPRPAGKSCDEYPFATTDQGASRTSQPDWGWGWVSISEQDSQGGLVSGFYNFYRVFDGTNGAGYKFWVAV
jgi:hypothetical protein